MSLGFTLRGLGLWTPGFADPAAWSRRAVPGDRSPAGGEVPEGGDPTVTAPRAELLPAMMRAAALRFWISRLWDFYLPRDAHLLTPHDPGHFERVLRARVETPWHFTRA